MKVSVIVPMFNEELNIKKLCQALKNQSYKNYEVILIDNLSEDKTIEIAKKYFPCFICKEKGSYAARNQGIKEASGDILLFTDADCVPDQNWISEMVGTIGDGYDVVAGKTIGGYLGKNNIYNHLVSELATASMQQSVINGNVCFFPTCNVGYRKDVILRLNCFRNETGGDILLSSLAIRNSYSCAINSQAIIHHNFANNVMDVLKRYFRYGASIKLNILGVISAIMVICFSPLQVINSFLYALIYSNTTYTANAPNIWGEILTRTSTLAGAIYYSVKKPERIF
jgi:glycosyltransferase involved in cell wall biosynthesis